MKTGGDGEPRRRYMTFALFDDKIAEICVKVCILSVIFVSERRAMVALSLHETKCNC